MVHRFVAKLKNRRMTLAIIALFVVAIAMLVVEFFVYYTNPYF
jgi:hypothetical protein